MLVTLISFLAKICAWK